MIRLDDPRLAAAITSLVDRRVAAALAAGPQVRYGVVAAVDPGTSTCSVFLGASTAPSPGFVYAGHTPPVVGDQVRVMIRGADRYVDDVLTAPAEAPRIGRSVVANVAQSVATSAGVRLVHQVATWQDDGTTTYTVGSMVIGRAGMYLVTVHAEFLSNASGAWRILGIGRNAGGHPTTWGGFGTPSNNTYAVSYPTRQTGSYRHRTAFVVPLAAGDWLGSFAYQDTGAALDVSNHELTVVRLGPAGVAGLLRGMLRNRPDATPLPVEEEPLMDDEKDTAADLAQEGQEDAEARRREAEAQGGNEGRESTDAAVEVPEAVTDDAPATPPDAER